MILADQYPSRYLRAADLNGPLQVTIASVELHDLEDAGRTERKPVCCFHEMEQALVLNKINGRTLAAMLGPDTDDWLGKVIELTVARVDFRGATVPAIRIAQASAAQPRTPTPAPTRQNLARHLRQRGPATTPTY